VIRLQQIPLDLGHRTTYLREDFLPAPSNAEALAWIERWPAWPTPALLLWGPTGCGKTHLATIWAAQAGATILTARDVARGDPDALLSGAAACAVEGLDAPFDEEALLHLFNRVVERRGHLLLTGQRAPGAWPVALPDLRSRLRAQPAVTVGPPDDALLASVLVKLFADRQLRVGEDVILYVASRMERSLEAARGVVAALDAASLAHHRRITLPLARRVLEAATGEDAD
jgi:DnaA regulatory inactivator Hda